MMADFVAVNLIFAITVVNMMLAPLLSIANCWHKS